MKIRNTIMVVLFSLVMACLSALEVDVPNEIPAYENLTITLKPSASEGEVAQARFFFVQEGKRDPLYSEFSLQKGEWKTSLPYTYLKGEELTYYTVMQNADGQYFRDPQIGTRKARLLQDTTPPKLKLISPKTFDLVLDKEQLVVFEILDESALTDFSISIDGEPALRSGAFENYLSFLIEPKEAKDSEISVKLTDRYGNTSMEKYTFTVAGEKVPLFLANAKYRSKLELEYMLDMGKSANTTDIQTMFGDLDHTLNLSFLLGGDAYLKAGPIALELYGDLQDTVDVFTLTDAYPNTLQADLQNILNLYNPIDFANEFDYTGEVPRKYENDNQFYAKLSFFGPLFTYQFGDQKETFQKETINDMVFRGTSLGFDTPFFAFKVSKGLSDLGLYQVAWPQNFLGFQLKFKARSAWYLQTNLSFISSLQGRYADLKVSSATSDIGTLYDLGSVMPEQNMVLGLSTGIATSLVNVDAAFSFTLYNDNASTVLDVNQLATDLKDQTGTDVSTYVGYLDKVQSVFPILDYFLPTNGLVSGLVDKDAWGISYGVDATVPSLGMEAWVRKTDATYKSLGSSIPTDEFTFGASIERKLFGFDVSGGYSYDQDAIRDILFNDIIALVKPDLAPSDVPTSANEIAHIVHTGQLGVDTPSHPMLGTVGLDYTFTWETTNADALADKATDAAVKSAILTSTENDVTLTHTGELRYRSGRYKLGDVTLNFGAKTKDSYITELRVDGTDTDTTFWEFSYALTPSVSFSRYAINLGFDQAWSTQSGSLTTYGYDAKFAIKQTFFDTINLTASFDQAFKTSLEAYRIGGGLSLEKRFGLISTSAALEVSFYDSLTDNTEDALTSSLTVKGTFSR
ncbi:MAG: hypothetical protein AB7C91_05665 [Sphaerochaeta sp.]|uniref:hypothetical protein n=1 Tax=Sphaerochaeta sp. TaxID=1972642 RepID=UPI003D10922C